MQVHTIVRYNTRNATLTPFSSKNLFAKSLVILSLTSLDTTLPIGLIQRESAAIGSDTGLSLST